MVSHSNANRRVFRLRFLCPVCWWSPQIVATMAKSRLFFLFPLLSGGNKTKTFHDGPINVNCGFWHPVKKTKHLTDSMSSAQPLLHGPFGRFYQFIQSGAVVYRAEVGRKWTINKMYAVAIVKLVEFWSFLSLWSCAQRRHYYLLSTSSNRRADRSTTSEPSRLIKIACRLRYLFVAVCVRMYET